VLPNERRKYKHLFSFPRVKVKVKIKQSRYRPSSPEGSRKLRFPDFMTTTQDGGKVVSPYIPAAFTPGNAPGTHFC